MKKTFLTYDDFVDYTSAAVKQRMPFLDEETSRKMARHGYNEMAKAFNARDVETIQKSLSITGIIPVDGSTGADALKQDDLVPQIMAMEKTMQDYSPFWTAGHKKPAISDVVQESLLTNFGAIRRGGAINASRADGGVSPKDPTLERRALQMGYLGGQFQVLRNALMIQALGLGVSPDAGNTEQVASEARLQALVLNANEMAWHGDHSIDANEPDGVLKQIRDEHSTATKTRIDCNGGPITQEKLEEAKVYHFQNGAVMTELWGGSFALADLNMQLLAGDRYKPGDLLTLGHIVDQLLVQNLGGDPAKAKVQRDYHLDPLPFGDELAADTDAPAAPASVTGSAGAQAVNWRGTNVPVGTHVYSVRAMGVNGRSAATASAGVVVVAGRKVTLTITNGVNALGTVKFFEVFRGTGATDMQYIGRVAGSAVASGGTTTFVDNGEVIPGTSTVVSLCNRPLPGNSYDIQFRQLMPVLNVKLPDAFWARQGGWVLGMTPQVLRPRFHVIFENVGRLTT